jgi:hypothetical protein
MPGQPMNAAVRNHIKPAAGADPITGHQCEGGTTPPALVTKGLWPLAARHLQVTHTALSCVNARFEKAVVEFSFDGQTLQAGQYRFTETDAAYSETLTIDPSDARAKVIYTVEKDEATKVRIGLSEAGVLDYATLDLPGGVHWGCSPAQ